MSTRERIIDTAIRLFNAQGTGPVSTNHIAAELGISPGNLYYHFHNKEEIVRAIYARLRPAWDAAMTLPTDRPPTVSDLRHLLEANAHIVWEYRFYYRELPALMRRDPELAAAYRDVRRNGLANITALLGYFVSMGLLRAPDDPTALSELARICWILADFWLAYEELGDDPIGPNDVERGVAGILRVLHPYLTDAARAELATDDAAPDDEQGRPGSPVHPT